MVVIIIGLLQLHNDQLQLLIVVGLREGEAVDAKVLCEVNKGYNSTENTECWYFVKKINVKNMLNADDNRFVLSSCLVSAASHSDNAFQNGLYDSEVHII